MSISRRAFYAVGYGSATVLMFAGFIVFASEYHGLGFSYEPLDAYFLWGLGAIIFIIEIAVTLALEWPRKVLRPIAGSPIMKLIFYVAGFGCGVALLSGGVISYLGTINYLNYHSEPLVTDILLGLGGIVFTIDVVSIIILERE